jgi:hypothetical protein
MAIGLGSAGLIALTAAAIGIATAPESAALQPRVVASDRGVWIGADLRL